MIGDRERLAAVMVRVNALNAELERANDRADRAAMEAERLKAQLEALTVGVDTVLHQWRSGDDTSLHDELHALAAARKAVQG
jgi:gamma-glutamyl:cysteine ligase YbdK (ATP-grasp superfamily)